MYLILGTLSIDLAVRLDIKLTTNQFLPVNYAQANLLFFLVKRLVTVVALNMLMTSYSTVWLTKWIGLRFLIWSNSFFLSFSIPYLTNKLAVYLGFSEDAWQINTVETATSTRNKACMRVSFFVLGKPLFLNFL